ncbi:MAG: class I SAM-dependent methyltransferase [Candidatus Pacearchaeota archaeon]|jgi:cyclopropane fatty-acyl-phospholipid synthase-like methyltransferase
MDKRYKSDLLRFKSINKFLKGKEILDIGSDEGYLHKLLVEKNPDKKFYTLDKLKGDYKIDLDSPKKIAKKFDTIIAGEVIEHLESPIKFVSYCKTLLNKKGRLIITTPNAIGLQYMLKPEWCVYYKEYRGHTQTFTIDMLKRICEDEGLKIVHNEYINAFWINNPIQYASKIFKRFRPDLIVVAEID